MTTMSLHEEKEERKRRRRKNKKLGWVLLGLLAVLTCVVFFLAWRVVWVEEISWTADTNLTFPSNEAREGVGQEGEANSLAGANRIDDPKQTRSTSGENDEAFLRRKDVLKVAILILVVLLLLIPLLWMITFHGEWTWREFLHEDEFHHWLSATSVPFLVLGLAMILELRVLMSDATSGLGAIAAIMILYCLSLLASFLYIEIRDSKRAFGRQLREASDWLQLQHRIGRGGVLSITPANAVGDLIHSWATIWDGVLEDARKSDAGELKENAMGILLATYAAEEANDIRAKVEPVQVPTGAWPWAASYVPKQNIERIEEATIFATNVGFYAKFLGEVVERLAPRMRGEPNAMIGMGLVTQVLPHHLWNWPYDENEHFEYPAVGDFRDCLLRLSSDEVNCKIFRKVILRDNDWSSRASLYSKEEWKRVRDWVFLVGKDNILQPLSSETRSCPGRYFKRYCVEELRWTEGLTTTTGKGRTARHVHWMLKQEPEKSRQLKGYKTKNVWSLFEEVMHPQGMGYTHIHVIPEELFTAPFLGEEEGVQGLNKCGELVFLGKIGRYDRDFWATHGEPSLILALLGTMSPQSETMFLTVVWGEKLLKSLYKSAQAAIKGFGEPIQETTSL